MSHTEQPGPLDYESPVDRRRRRPSRRKVGIKGGALVAVALVLLLVYAILSPETYAPHDVANRVKCASNLCQIGQACQLYANDHEGRYPVDFAALLAEDYITAKVFLCPSRHANVPTTYPSSWVITESDYVYAGAGLTTNTPAEVIVAYERPNAHDGDGMNILFADGHVEFIVKKDLPATFQASATARQKWEASLPTTSRSNP